MPGEIQKQIDVLRPPSKLRYFFFGFIAFFADVVDVAAAITGIGILLSLLVDIVAAPILFMAGHGARTRMKTMRSLGEKANIHIERLGRKLIQIRRYYAGAIRMARRIPGLSKTVRKTVLYLRAARLKIVRDPRFKNLAAIVADLVPYLDLIPWRTAAIYFTYRDEMRTYKETLENLNQALVVEKQINQFEIDARKELLTA